MRDAILRRYGSSLVLMVILAGLFSIVSSCGGGGGGGGGGVTGLTISGVVKDSTVYPPVPVDTVIVTVRKTDKSAVATATSAADGTFTLTNVPASTEIYINTSKPPTYASTNTEIVSLTDSLSGAELSIIPAATAKSAADAYYGSSQASSWNDPFYANRSWFAMTIWDASDNAVVGVTVGVTPSGPTILYNDGNDNFSITGPTVGMLSEPLVGGYHSSEGVYTFNPWKSATMYYIKLPLVMGEMSYVDIWPW